MNIPRSVVLGSVVADPSVPTLFGRTNPQYFGRDEVLIQPPRDQRSDLEKVKEIVESGRSVYLELATRPAGRPR